MASKIDISMESKSKRAAILNISTSGNTHTNMTSKNLERQHEKIKIGFVSKQLVSTRNAHSLLYWITTISLILCSLGGLIFGICSWISVSSNFDASKATKLSSDFDQVMTKYGTNMNVDSLPASHENELNKRYPKKDIGPSTDLFPDDTETTNNSLPTLTFSTGLKTSDTNYEQGGEASERTTMEFTTIDIDIGDICEQFEFSTKDNISKSPLSLTRVMGIYALDNYYRYNDKAVYYNPKRDVFLYYHAFKNYRTLTPYTDSVTYPVISGLWFIGNYPGEYADKGFSFVANPFCADAKYPANGECGFGWHYFNESRFGSALGKVGQGIRIYSKCNRYVQEAKADIKHCTS